MTEMFRTPFAERLDLMRNALGSLSRYIPEVEGMLRYNGRRDDTLLVCSTIKWHILEATFAVRTGR
jgi:hypothetical protein